MEYYYPVFVLIAILAVSFYVAFHATKSKTPRGTTHPTVRAMTEAREAEALSAKGGGRDYRRPSMSGKTRENWGRELDALFKAGLLTRKEYTNAVARLGSEQLFSSRP